MGIITTTINKYKRKMKKEEFEKAMASLNVKRNSIEEEMRKAQQEFMDSYPIKEGDVCKDETGRKCWFNYLRFDSVNTANPTKVVNYPKKDGTRSNRDILVYGELTKMDE